MAELKYVDGDATDPQLVNDENIVIPHIVNSAGIWSSGFVIAVSNRWPHVKDHYQQRHEAKNLLLSSVDFVTAEDGIVIANMVAQVQPGGSEDRPPIRYGALVNCMQQVSEYLKLDELENYTDEIHGSIHAPMFGSARAGGNFEVIEAMILELWVDKGIDVTIYQYEE